MNNKMLRSFVSHSFSAAFVFEAADSALKADRPSLQRLLARVPALPSTWTTSRTSSTWPRVRQLSFPTGLADYVKLLKSDEDGAAAQG